jgi:tetratricopeptide (TPR) repeat protein
MRLSISSVLFFCFTLLSSNAFCDQVSSAEADFKAGNENYQQGKFEEAKVAYQSAMKKDASLSHPEMLFNLSLTLRQLGQANEADALYATFIKSEHNRLLGLNLVQDSADGLLFNKNRSFFEHCLAPEYVVWHNWIAKYLMYILGIATVIFTISMLGDRYASNGEKWALLLFPVAIGLFTSGYFV